MTKTQIAMIACWTLVGVACWQSFQAVQSYVEGRTASKKFQREQEALNEQNRALLAKTELGVAVTLQRPELIRTLNDRLDASASEHDVQVEQFYADPKGSKPVTGADGWELTPVSMRIKGRTLALLQCLAQASESDVPFRVERVRLSVDPARGELTPVTTLEVNGSILAKVGS